MKQDSGPEELELGELLEYEREREEIKEEREAVRRIDVAAKRASQVANRAQPLLIGSLILGIVVALAAVAVILLHWRTSERLVRIEQQMSRAIAVQVDHLETGSFDSGSAICASANGATNPCENVCRYRTLPDGSKQRDCRPLTSLAEDYQDAAVVFVAGGHDGQELTESMRKSFGCNCNLAMTRARMVQDLFREALERSRSRKLGLEYPNTLFLPSIRGRQGTAEISAQDRTVRLAIVRVGEPRS